MKSKFQEISQAVMGKKTEQLASEDMAEISAPYVWEKSYASDVSWACLLYTSPSPRDRG